jgi:hypothetical protein
MKISLICNHCNKEFETQYKFRDKKFCSRECYFNSVREGKTNIGRLKDDSVRETRVCKVCDNEFIVRKKQKKTMCSDECRRIWANKPENKDKLKESIKNGVIKKYGVEHIWSVKSIHKKTMLNRDRDESIRKQKETVRNKHLKKLLPKLKDNGIKLLDEYSKNKNGNTSLPYNFKCLVCDNIFNSTLLGSGIIPRCTKCYNNIKNNKLETFITDFLNDNDIKFITNSRKIIPPKEIDIFIPDYNLAIELNGLYWHGELNGKDKNYHIKKTKNCYNKNITLLHFSEDDIINKGNIILSILRNKLKLNTNKIYARKCIIKKIDNKQKTIFMNNNHLGGGNTKDSVSYALLYNNEIVSVMSFSKRKITKGTPSWEISRFANKLNHTVIGSFSRLFNKFLLEYNPDMVISYVDLRLSSYDYKKSVYYNNGMELDSYTPPNYWYFYRSDNKEKFHRYKFRKDVLVKEGFDYNKTEWEIMKERGFDRLWDCGNIKFIYKK